MARAMVSCALKHVMPTVTRGALMLVLPSRLVRAAERAVRAVRRHADGQAPECENGVRARESRARESEARALAVEPKVLCTEPSPAEIILSGALEPLPVLFQHQEH